MAEMPFDFEWCYPEICDVLIIDEPETVPELTITITNRLTEEVIDFIPCSPDEIPDSNNYHFRLTLNPGVLVNPADIRINSNDWVIKYDDSSSFSNLYLYFLWVGSSELSLSHTESIELVLTGVAAEGSEGLVPSGSDESTELSDFPSEVTITVSWPIEDNISIHKAAPPLGTYANQIDLTLSFYQGGEMGIPLYVGFVSDNKIFNVNEEIVSDLKLRITNINDPTKPNPRITFKHDDDSSKASGLVLVLEIGEKSHSPWALCTDDQANNITITCEEQFEQVGSATPINVNGIVKAYQWNFIPTTDIILEVQETIIFNITGIVTEHPTGETNLYVKYNLVPGYQDGQFICQIEKSPMVLNDNHVNIATNESSSDSYLSVRDGLRFIKGAENQTSSMALKLDILEGKLPQLALVKSDDINLMTWNNNNHVNINGNLGIGVDSPQNKLEVNGSALITYNITGNGNIIGNGDIQLPFGYLNCGTVKRQHINFHGSEYGIGVQDATTYFRSDSDFAWFRRGSHSDSNLDPGSGGTLQMVIHRNGNVGIGTANPQYKLDVNGNASVNGDIQINTGHLNCGTTGRQNINLYGQGHGIGVQYATTYFRSNSNFAWFMKGSHSGDYLDPGSGGTVQMVIRESGNVGIGTKDPRSKLTVEGGNIDVVNGNIRINGGPVMKKVRYHFPYEEKDGKESQISTIQTDYSAHEWEAAVVGGFYYNLNRSLSIAGVGVHVEGGSNNMWKVRFEIIGSGAFAKDGKYCDVIFMRRELFY